MKPQFTNFPNSQKIKDDNTDNVLFQQSDNKIGDRTGQNLKCFEKRDYNCHEIAVTKIAAESDHKLPIFTPLKFQKPIFNESPALKMKHRNPDLSKRVPPDKKMNTQ